MHYNKKISSRIESHFEKSTPRMMLPSSFFKHSPLSLNPSFCKENTIRTSVSCKGVGVHSGQETGLWIHPAPAGSGIQFRRTDVKDKPNSIRASWVSVTDTTLCTKLSNEYGISISTVEHLMSALAACRIQNAFIDVDGPEVPIMDGSALPFYELIQKAGIKTQKKDQTYVQVLKPVKVGDSHRYALLTPSSAFSLSFEFDFQGRHDLPSQTFTFTPHSSSFLKEIAPARTFGFVEDVNHLRQVGLALGASLENSVGLSNGKILNEEGLRYADEFVRHKLLDALGDLSLAGMPLLGSYHGLRAGHSLNSQVLKALFSDPQAFAYVTLTPSEETLPFPERSLSSSSLSSYL